MTLVEHSQQEVRLSIEEFRRDIDISTRDGSHFVVVPLGTAILVREAIEQLQQSSAAAAPLLTDEREAFEAWIGLNGHIGPKAQRVEDTYTDNYVGEMWEAWQARATLGASPIPAPMHEQAKLMIQRLLAMQLGTCDDAADFLDQLLGASPSPKTMREQYADLLRIQRAEAETGDPYMVGLYNGMSMMCANVDNEADWDRVRCPVSPSPLSRDAVLEEAAAWLDWYDGPGQRRAEAIRELKTQPTAAPAQQDQAVQDQAMDWPHLPGRPEETLALLQQDQAGRMPPTRGTDSQQDELGAMLHGTMDAQVWATEFCRLNNASDHGMMLGWFANAIMVGYDHAKREGGNTSKASAESDQQEARDAARLMFVMREIDGYGSVELDKYDYAVQFSSRAGRSEVSDQDELNGVRALIDAAMAAETAPLNEVPAPTADQVGVPGQQGEAK